MYRHQQTLHFSLNPRAREPLRMILGLDIDNMRHLYEKFKCGACWQPIYVADRDLIESDVGLIRTLFVSLGADVE